MFTDWDDGAYEQEIITTALDCPEALMNINRGHALNLHTDQTDIELIGRIVRENKPIASTFTKIDGYPVIEIIGDVIAHEASKVTDWIMSKRCEFSKKSDYELLTLNLDTRNHEPIGYGFRRNLRKYETTAINVVLKRDHEGENKYGFYILTAYPDIIKGRPTRTWYEGKDLACGNKNLSVLEKMFLAVKDMPIFARIGSNPRTEEQELTLSKTIDDKEKYTAFITEKSCQVQYRVKNNTRMINKRDLEFECPILFQAIEKADLYKKIAVLVDKKNAEREAYLVQKTCNQRKKPIKSNYKKERKTK